MRQLRWTGALSAVLLLLTGCIAAVIGDAPHSGTPVDARARGDARPDTALAGDVRAALRNSSWKRPVDFGVEARAGVVTLQGAVASTAERERAARIARAVSGVGAVNNLLEVR